MLAAENPFENSDGDLVARFNCRDEQAFNLIVRRYQKRIFDLVFRFVRDFDESSDIAQETFIRAHAKLKEFRGASALYTWLYRIAVNLSLNHMRKKKLRSFFSFDDPGVEEPIAEGGPEEDLAAVQIRAQVGRAIEKLPPRQRSIFILRQYERLTHKEIAAVLACSEGSIRAGYFHALKKLRAMLKECA